MKAFITFIHFVIDFIFPKNEIVRKVEAMSVDELLEHSEGEPLAVFAYKDPFIRQAIWEMKYRRNTKIISLFAKAMAHFVMEEVNEEWIFSHKEKILLVPIPLSAKRKRFRGFNQMEEFAKALMKELPGDFFDLAPKALSKVTDTLPQTKTRNKKERLRNLKHVFEVADKSKVKGRTIILLDDVTTTGATLHEAAGALKKSGARRIFPIAIAH